MWDVRLCGMSRGFLNKLSDRSPNDIKIIYQVAAKTTKQESLATGLWGREVSSTDFIDRGTNDL